jgi:hypothetical protein
MSIWLSLFFAKEAIPASFSLFKRVQVHVKALTIIISNFDVRAVFIGKLFRRFWNKKG